MFKKEIEEYESIRREYLFISSHRESVNGIVMGTYINIGNAGFKSARNSEYIDKSGLIAVVNKTLSFFSAVIVLFALMACSININQGVNVVSTSSKGFTDAPSKKVSVKSFSAITNNGPIIVDYQQSKECGIVILGDTNMFDSLRTEVVGDELCIELKPGTYKDLWMKVLVYAPNISSVHQNGSGDIVCDIIDQAQQLYIAASGSGNIQVKCIDCNDVKMQVNGSGNINAETVIANKAQLSVNGSGGVHLQEVNVDDELSAETNGSGNISVNGTAQNVKANVAGSGTITGKLDHKHIETSTTGSGRVDFQ